MANALYDYGREGFLTGAISWTSDNIKACLVDTGTYTVNLATHQYLSSVSGIVATSSNFSGKTATAGVADADDLTFTAVSGSSVEALIIYKDSGSGAATSNLIAYIDTATGLPLTPNGGNVTITFAASTPKIFKL